MKSVVRPRTRGALLVGAVLLLLVAIGCDRPAAAGPSVTAAELADRLSSGQAPLVLDVRSEREFAAGHIPGALNIPHDQLASRLGELPTDRSSEIVVHCQSGKRAAAAEAVLADAGYSGWRDLSGHWAGWSAAGLPQE